MTATISNPNTAISQVNALAEKISADYMARVRATGVVRGAYFQAIKAVCKSERLTVAQVGTWYTTIRAFVVADQSIGIDLDTIGSLQLLYRVGKFVRLGSNVADDEVVPAVHADLRRHGWKY